MKTLTESTLTKWHHLPDHERAVELEGLTIREALKLIREMDLGDLGGLHLVELSDGTMLTVDNDPGHLMRAQKAIRWEWVQFNGPRVIRKYKI